MRISILPSRMRSDLKKHREVQGKTGEDCEDWEVWKGKRNAFDVIRQAA